MSICEGEVKCIKFFLYDVYYEFSKKIFPYEYDCKEKLFDVFIEPFSFYLQVHLIQCYIIIYTLSFSYYLK